MTNPYFNWPTSVNRFVALDTARAADINDALDELSAGLDEASVDIESALDVVADATTQAGIATTQAGIATTKASEASASAVSAAASASAATTHIARTDNPHSTTKAHVGLGNADNTSDATKPVSAAAQSALDSKVDKSSPIFNVISGYGAGAGGTVTQATSKSTAVTLDKPNGQITMNSATLAGGGSVSFVVNNSLVTSTDRVLVTGDYISVVDPSNYRVELAYTATGSFKVRVTNVSGSDLSQALVIGFALIRGSTT